MFVPLALVRRFQFGARAGLKRLFIPMIFIQLLFCQFIMSLYRFNEAQRIGAFIEERTGPGSSCMWRYMSQ